MALADIPAELIRQCQQGEPGAFDRLYDATRDDLFRFCFSMLRDEDDALEVLQECFVRIYRHLHRLKDPERFGAWATRVAVNQANSFRVRRTRNRMQPLEEGWQEADEDQLPLQAAPAPDPRAAASRAEVLELVNEAIRQLPPRQRTAVLLFDVKDWSLKEIAEHMECSEGAVKFNVFQGRRKLRALLGGFVGDDGRPAFDDAR